MDKKIKDLELEKYGYNTRQRLELISEENFSVCQHMMDKDIDKVLTVPHSHNYYEIELLLYGKVLEVVNGEEMVSEQGGFVFVSPNDIHTCEFIEDKAIFLVIKIKHEIFTPKLQKILQIANFPVKGIFSKEEYEYIGMSVENMQKVQEKIKDKEIFKSMAYKMLEALVLYILGRSDEIKEQNEYVSNKNSGMNFFMPFLRKEKGCPCGQHARCDSPVFLFCSDGIILGSFAGN